MSIQFYIYIYVCYKYRALISADLFDYNFDFFSGVFALLLLFLSLVYCVCRLGAFSLIYCSQGQLISL